MPYASDEDLPPSVRNHLPAHAREIFRTAFNHAWEVYGRSPHLEEIAHRVAWAAVKRRYRKARPEWVLVMTSVTIAGEELGAFFGATAADVAARSLMRGVFSAALHS